MMSILRGTPGILIPIPGLTSGAQPSVPPGITQIDLHMATPIKFIAEVTRVLRHAEDVATYEFRCLARHPRYKPGQFLHLALDAYDPAGHWPESRVFTIANGPAEPGFLRLTIAQKGRFTARILRELTPGRQVWMKAPYGEFLVHAETARETVLVAGGTGVTPFVAFLEDACLRGLGGEAWLHYGARRAELLIFKDLAEQSARRLPLLRAEFYAESGARGNVRPGRIDLDRAVRTLKGPRDAIFYLCGPQAMVDAFSLRLGKEFGVPARNVRVDQWE
jgi:ferredoxin-NADP reductase